jgi:hypothetical protein
MGKQMINRIVFFSGGLSSFAVAHHLKIKFPQDNIVLYFTDTKWEDEDLYRFIDEVSDKLQLPLLKHSSGIDPVELMIKRHALFSNRFGECSKVLKMAVARKFIKRGKKPKFETWYNKQYLKSDDFLNNPVLYFGIAFGELHRLQPIKTNWQPFQVEFPLAKEFYDYDDLLKLYNIEKPSLYLKGFAHNNCKARCVKAGVGHYKTLYNTDRDTFDQIEHVESLLSIFVAVYHQFKGDETWKDKLKYNDEEMLKWHKSNFKYVPQLYIVENLRVYSFMKDRPIRSIREEMENGGELDLFKDGMGGCGCFVNYEDFKQERLKVKIK